MTVRWRLAIFCCQFIAIAIVTWWVTGQLWSSAVWFGALLAYAVNRQLLEPYFARPVDVLANTVFALGFYIISSKSVAAQGWHVLAIALATALFLSASATLLGANRVKGKGVRLARASRVLSGPFSAAVIYSAVFWLGLLDFAGGVTEAFWRLSLAWVVTIALGTVNWQAVWATARSAPLPVIAEGLIGPSKLLIAGPSMPAQGALVKVEGGGESAIGTVLARVRRASDVWGAIHIADPAACETFLSASTLTVGEMQPNEGQRQVLGIVDVASTHSAIVFSTTRALNVGDVVSVRNNDAFVLYQVSRGEVIGLNVKGGGHLAIQARAVQLGQLDTTTLRITRYRWVAEPGAPVTRAPATPVWQPAQDRFLLGHLIGTDVPVFLDPSVLCGGHLAILGMTKMGKTTLAARLANSLSQSRAVIVMDQTGEYRTKRNLAEYVEATHDDVPGISVFEPAAGRVIPDEGLNRLRHFANKGYTEYRAGVPFSRVLLIDEAHQFVPEPALLGFGSPGRESAIAFGMYAMQVRKYGVTLILISQRTAVLAKSALSQCENVIALKSVDQTGLDYLEAVLGPEARDILPSLGPGEAMVSGPAISSDSPVAVKLAIDENLAAPNRAVE